MPVTGRSVLSALIVMLLAAPLVRAEGDGGDDCDGCKFFPNVCEKIDYCIENCNIAPTMRSSCSEL